MLFLFLISNLIYKLQTQTEIQNLLHAVANGDEQAFALLLRIYWNKVYTQAITYLKSSVQAQEITQDVFVKIWEQREKLTDVQSFADYLFIISRNQLISALRKKKQDSELPSEFLEEKDLRPDSQLHYKESYNKIHKLIEELPPVRKKVFHMSRMEGMSYDEIGQSLGISRNGVKDHIVKALNFLRSRLSGSEEFLLLFITGSILLVQ